MSKIAVALILFCCFLNQKATGKIYGRCELAWELYSYHNIPKSELSTWVCLAHHTSEYNTSPLNVKNCHGIFQICQGWWCEVDKYGGGCNMICADFTDDSISDDVHCAKIVHKAHTKTEGNGFKAFKAYPNCTQNTEHYLEGCF